MYVLVEMQIMLIAETIGWTSEQEYAYAMSSDARSVRVLLQTSIHQRDEPRGCRELLLGIDREEF